MNSETKVKIVRDDGATFYMGGSMADDADWIMYEEIEGIDSPSIENFSASEAVSDGSIITGSHINERVIRFQARVKNRGLNDVCRRLALRFFNQKHKFKLYITYMGLERWIDGIIDAQRIPSGNVFHPQTLDISFLCADPFFKSVDDFGKNIAAITPMFAFPYIQTEKIPVVSAYYNYARNVNIENDGDVDTFMQAIIRVLGDVTDPMIFKDETKYVRMLGTYHEGDVINIDMVNLIVTVNGEKAMSKLDKSSSFTDCAITVGANTVGFDAADGKDYMEVNIYYNKKYTGI